MGKHTGRGGTHRSYKGKHREGLFSRLFSSRPIPLKSTRKYNHIT